jgi:hypothetical protein
MQCGNTIIYNFQALALQISQFNDVIFEEVFLLWKSTVYIEHELLVN